MPKAKMKFPEVPGDSPREKFINLVRRVFATGNVTTAPARKRSRKVGDRK